jgi:acyl transferase domain-containing protein/phosphopantetheinyl transferase
MKASEQVAIVGMGVLLPGAKDLRSYWSNVVDGSDAISDAPVRRLDARYYEPHPSGPGRADQIPCRRGGFVDDVADVDTARLGITVEAAQAMEPEQLIALHVAAAATDDAGGVARLGDPDRVGVVLGRAGYLSAGMAALDQRVRTARQLAQVVGTLVPWLSHEDVDRVRDAFTDSLAPQPAEAVPGLVPNLVATRIASLLGARGPAYTIDAACASSLAAVDAAVLELSTGRCDAVLAGGVHHCHDVTLWSLLGQLGVLSASQRIRPLQAGADGLLPAEGTGVIVLKRLDDARAAGDRVYAVIRGTGMSSDGRDGITAADPASQALAITRAWEAAGLDPREPGAVGLIEAHGAGIPDVDAAELAALGQVFGPGGDADVAVIGSVKAMIGHAMSAAGIAGLVKAALAVHHGVLPPMPGCEQPRPDMDSTRFRPLPAACPWVSAGPRRAGVNAFGFGGVNAHVVLEQAPAAQPAPERAVASVNEPELVLRFAAPTPEALIEMLDGDDTTLRERGAGVPAYPGPGSRLGLVDPTTRRLAVARRTANGARGGGWAAWRGRNDVWLSSEPLLSQSPARIAFVFPGLEAEYAPRIDDVAAHFGLPPAELPSGSIGRHATGVMRTGRVLELALRRMGIVPDALAGHSIGEWNAMYASGMFDAADADAAIFGEVMADTAALDVDYASLACPVEQALEAIAGHSDIVLSHDNAPLQSVVCGPPASIEALAREQRHRNVLVQVMPFRSGYHTPMLSPYMEQLGRGAAALPIRRPARTELWSATLVGRYPDPAEEVRELYLRHLLEPVRFRPLVLAMYEAGVRVFIQVGQGRLGNLIDGALDFLPHLTVAANSSRHPGLDQLRRVAVALWVEGGTPDFQVLEAVADAPSLTSAPRPDPAEALPGKGDGSPSRPLRVRLDRAGGLVSLDPALLPQPAAHPVVPAAAELAVWARSDPLAQELLGLMNDTAQSAVAALSSAASGAGETAERQWLEPAAEQEPAPLEGLTVQLHVSMDTMPYLADHCLNPQRWDWPEFSDKRPVVPGTTIVQLMLDHARSAAPGREPVSVSEIRLDRWLPAAPPTEATVRLQPAGADTVSVAVGEFARSLVRLAPAYPDAHRPLWPCDVSREVPPALSGPDIYRRRWMFHGPQFQGIAAILGHGPEHVRAVLSHTTAPGSLLDAAGQLLGYYARVNLPDRYTMFPAGIDRIDFYGPEPKPGTPVECLAWVPWRDQDQLLAHFQLTVDGKVWAEVSGWHARRFGVPVESDEAMRFPERHTVSRLMPGGWMLATESWSDMVGRDLFAGRYLGRAEHQEWQRQPPRGRRQWLLGRIAAKDAVRRHLWDDGYGEIFPAELRIDSAATGAPGITGEYGFKLPPTQVSIAHSAEVAVAIARAGTDPPGPVGTGIDVEQVREHPQSTLDAALTPDERQLLYRLVDSTELTVSQWFTRFWTAKEAAAKALGTGLGGAPRRFVVSQAVPAASRPGATTDQLTVAGPASPPIEVSATELANPPHLPPRDYIVAWTVNPGGQS